MKKEIKILLLWSQLGFGCRGVVSEHPGIRGTQYENNSSTQVLFSGVILAPRILHRI